MLRAVACVALIAACTGARPAATPAAPVAPVVPDPHSAARPERVRVRHLALDLRVDFARRALAGTARLDLVRVDPAATEVVLDTHGLAIEAVTDCASGRALGFALAPPHPVIGEALTIQLAPAGAAPCVAVRYATRPEAEALLWLDAAITAGQRHPMLFTQSQAILARSWIPLQDTPGVRFTYEARIAAPPGVRALMSADNAAAATADGVWVATQRHPIPSYLVALAVGDFAFRPLGPRTGVYAEPAVVDAAAHEFAEVEAMMTTAEGLYGPYRWGRYDILVLPPSFPFGGMENPQLTFLTPTVINGDRALVSLIAHELAHSWSGNLVTNATWNDLWLNEGVTTYVERRIMEALRGVEAAELEWALSRRDLDAAVARIGPTSPDTHLALAFPATRSPDEAPGDIAYEKGAQLLRALERALGRDRFDAFLRARFDRLAFQSSDSATFARDLAPLLATTSPPFDLDAWLHGPGVPATVAPATSARFAEHARRAEAFAATGALPDAAGWGVPDWLVFLQLLPPELPAARLEALDARYHLTASPNAVLAARWLPLVIRADVRAAAPTVAAYAARVGRRHLVLRIYEAMVGENAFWRQLAADTFARARAGYHPVTRGSIADLVGATGDAR